MISFKQFLTEGGAATSDFGTQRATKSDIEKALKFTSKHTGIPIEQLENNLLGSTAHVLSGQKDTAGDIDIAVERGRYSKEELDTMVQKMKTATGMDKVHFTGGATYSFAVPVGAKKVQVDLMLVSSEKWARFGYTSHPKSKYKGVIRNLLIAELIKRLFEKDKDLEIKNEKGESVVRVRRGFKSDAGLERLFRVGKVVKKRDGTTPVELKAATPQEVEQKLKELGIDKKFSKDADAILDPEKAAEFLFGAGVKSKDAMSAEQVISLIKKRPDHKEIFQDAIKSLEKVGQKVPAELEDYR